MKTVNCPDCGRPIDDRLDRCARCMLERPGRAERVYQGGEFIGWMVK